MKRLIVICLALVVSLVSILGPSISAGTINSPKGAGINGPHNAHLSAKTQSLLVGEFPITIDPANQYDPAISGNTVVWVDYRNGNSDIYGYDLSTQTEFAICTGPQAKAMPGQGPPATSGDIVVWTDRRNGNDDIYGYDLSTQTEFPICTDPAHQGSPAVSGDIVVWVDYRNGNSDIYGYDLSIQTEFPISTDPASQDSVAISGGMVVWMDSRGNDDIYGYDLSTQTEFAICTDPTPQRYPAISGDIVVWWDNRGGGDIYGYDLSIQAEFPICTHPASQGSVAISGDIVVWKDRRNGNHDIYGYDLSTQTEFPIRTDPAIQSSPAVSGDTVVWVDYRNGNRDIYGQQFSQPIVALQVEPTTFNLEALEGGAAPAEQELFIYKIGTPPLTWTATKDADWLSISLISGTAPSTMSISVGNTGLTAGHYTGLITITATSPGVLNSPQRVVVNFTIAKTRISGIIDQDTTWTVGYIVEGDLTVNDGVVLTIEPGVEIWFATTDALSSGKDPDKVEMIVAGALVADGVTFTSNADSPTAGDWYGIRFLDSSADWDGSRGSAITDSTIQYGTVGISIDGASPMISHNIIANMKGKDGVVTSCLEDDDQNDGGNGYGINITDGSSPEITGNIVTRIFGGKGKYCWITGAYVAGDGGDAVAINIVGSSPSIIGNDISGINGANKPGVGVGGNSGLGLGIHVSASSTDISGNRIALVSGGSGAAYRHGSGLGAGIYVRDGSLVSIQDNIISRIGGGAGASAQFLKDHYSRPHNGGAGVGIYAAAGSSVVATNNILTEMYGGHGGAGVS